MVNGILSPAFLQSAGQSAKNKDMLSFTGSEADPTIQQLVCTSAIVIESVKNGTPLVQDFPAGTHDALEIQADAETKVVIRGTVTELYMTKYNDDPDIEDYEGYMSLSSIDISESRKLRTLCVAFNDGLTELNLAANTALTELDCNSCTGLTELDLAANTALTVLSCGSISGLTSLDLSTNTALTYLECNNCPGLTELDLAANTALTYLDCNSCTGLTELDLAANTALTVLSCVGISGLTSLDLSTNTALTHLNCFSCTGLTELDLSTNTALTYLNCFSCTGLTSLDLSTNTALTSLDCNSCTGLTELSYPGANSDVSIAIANAITNATASDGTVYTDSTADYYSTIADAATAKGWTIEQIQA